ncbi:CDP-alcohol phosphatidyltransferase family protein [Pseudidiomarina mangrovi]|uniref:CDP-alcohol phosphatidyltransferase family protein n=1 Tax=Pseudidiomarina mangrovi TaxID=2487133 RepID=UPI000FCAB8C3|nr:CDP-alcohol phosphatidyltransferase family protein [Pseudidiomarina mangrovi]
MIDPWWIKQLRQPLKHAAQLAVKLGVSANQVTVASFLIGMLAVPALALEQYYLALVAILLNRIGDGLDGAIARINGTTDAGGYLDISLDFIFYSAVPFGFLLADPVQNGVAAGLLMLTFMGTGATFLAFAAIAAKRGIDNPNYPNKSLHYLGGLTEGFETIAVFVVICVLPQFFVELAYGFALLCWVTALSRLYAGYRTLELPGSSAD